MANNADSQNNKLIVLSILTGSDAGNVLKQTQLLKPPVPSKSSSAYPDFLENFKKSPSNNVTTIANFLRVRAKWSIDAVANYQQYLDSFNGAPFISGYGGGTGANVKSSEEDVENLIHDLLQDIGLPINEIDDVIDDYGLVSWLSSLSADENKDSTLSLTLIVQNLVANDNNLSLYFKKSELTFDYNPGRKGNLAHKKVPPAYSYSGKITVAKCSFMPASYFEQNAEQFLNLGFTNVKTWMEETTSPPSLMPITPPSEGE